MPTRTVAARRASEIEPVPVRTIWHGRFIRGSLNLIAGSPGAGKSSLIALAAAELSRDGHTVILSNSEDDAASVTVPRLLVADAILERIHVIPQTDVPVFPDEFEGLEVVIARTGTACVIIDPIGAHFQPEFRVHQRPTLRKLVGIAARTGCAIVGIHHTTKAGEIGGPNSGLRGTARAVYVYGFDPQDEDRRLLSVDKVNGIAEPPAIRFDHEVVEHRVGRELLEVGRLVRGRESIERASRRRGRRDPERDAACHAWLSEYLAAGYDCERKSTDVHATGRAEGYSQATLNRAKTVLEVEHVRRGGYGADGWWVWRLPDEHPLRTGSAADSEDEEPEEPSPVVSAQLGGETADVSALWRFECPRCRSVQEAAVPRNPIDGPRCVVCCGRGPYPPLMMLIEPVSGDVLDAEDEEPECSCGSNPDAEAALMGCRVHGPDAPDGALERWESGQGGYSDSHDPQAHVGHRITVEKGHDGSAIGARCQTCETDLHPEDCTCESCLPF